MRFRLGLVTGFAAGYYLGSRAGRQRYDQINRTLSKLRRSEAFEQAADQVKTVVEEGVDKARSLVETRAGNGHGDGPMPASSVAATDETVSSAPLTTTPPPTTASTVPPSAGTTGPTGPPIVPQTGDEPAGGSGSEPGPKGLGGYSSSR